MSASEPIGLYALAYYLKRIRSFLESDKKTLSFPRISSQLQNVLVKIITEGTEFVHNDAQFDNAAKMEAAKLTAAFEAHTNIKLMHEFQDGIHGLNVLVYKKTNLTTSKPQVLVKKASVDQTIASNDLTTDLSPLFKLRYLNLTAKFVKNETQLVLKYPQMVPCQAEFIMNMLIQGKEGKLEETEVGYGYRSMYAPLWESMKVFSLKYDYKIEYIPLLDECMKCVVFEKIPKFNKPKKKNVDVSTTLNSSISPQSSTASPKLPSKAKQTTKTVAKKTLKLVTKMKTLLTNNDLCEEFVCDALHRISEFMYDKEQGSIMFAKIDNEQQYFLEHVEALSKTDMAYMLFDSECQKYLCDIRYCVSKKMLFQTRMFKYGSKKHPLKDLLFEKLCVYPTIEMEAKREENDENVSNNILDSPTHLIATLQNDEKRLARLKAIKDQIVRTDGESYILNRLQEISDFLRINTESDITFHTKTSEQALFIKFVHVLSKLEEAYGMFSRECQKLLRSIRTSARNYELQFRWEIDEYDDNNRPTVITISKKPVKVKAREEETKRSRSLSAVRRSPRLAEKTSQNTETRPRGSSGQRPLNCKEKLLEGLKQPVQSDKAVRIMQSMGWTGGALGLRGEGIVEPIMPSIDLAKRAGLGHVPKPKKVAPKKKSNAPNQEVPTDILPEGIVPVASLPPNLVPPGILMGLPPDATTKVVYLNTCYHTIVLRSILELVTTDLAQLHFVYTAQKTRPRKVANFIKQAVQGYNSRSRIGLNDWVQLIIIEETMVHFVANQDLMLSAGYVDQGVMMRKLGYKPDVIIPESEDKQSGRQWYPSTLVIDINVEHPAKPQEKLLASIIKPLEEQTTVLQKQQDVETTIPQKQHEVETTVQNTIEETNNKTPPYLKTLARRCLRSLTTDSGTSTKTKMATSEMQEVDTTTAQKQQVKTTLKQTTNSQISQEIIEMTRHSQDILTDLRTEPTNQTIRKRQEIQTNAQKQRKGKTVSKKMQEMEAKLKQWQMKTTTPEKLKEVKISRSSRRKRKREEKGNTNIKFWVEPQQLKPLPQTQEIQWTDFKIPKTRKSAKTPETQKVKTTISQQELEVTTTTIPNPQTNTTETTQAMSTTNTTEQGYILLEKFPANNNDTTQNKNAQTVNNVKNTLANYNTRESNPTTNNAMGRLTASVEKEPRVVDYMDLTGDFIRKIDINDVRPRKDETLETNTAFAAMDVNKIKDTDKMNNQPDINDVICSNNAKALESNACKTMKTDSKTGQNNSNSRAIIDNELNVQNDKETVSYIMLAESKTIAELDNLTDTKTNTTNEDKSENDLNQNDNSNSTQESETDQPNVMDKSDKVSLFDYEDSDDCLVILNDSDTLIEIDSEDENNLLISDDETNSRNTSSVKAKKIFKPRVSCDIASAVDALENFTTDEIKTEKEDLDLTSIKNRKRPSVELKEDATKKCKLLADFKKLCILPQNPQNQIDNEKASEIQTCILNAIDYTKEKLPLLSCQGIQNGGLVYSCQDEESLFFMEDLINKMCDLKIVYEFEVQEKISHKMAFRINSYVEESVTKILGRLELYNNGLNASKWGFIKKEQYGDFIVIYVEIDESSFNYVCNSNFVLYAGNDCAKFTIVWD